MSVGRAKADNKYNRKSVKKVKQQREFDVMEKRPSRNAKARFREEPYQMRYRRMLKERGRSNGE